MNGITKITILFTTNTMATIISCITFHNLMTSRLDFSPIKNKLKDNYILRLSLSLLLSVAIFLTLVFSTFIILQNI